MKNYLMISLVCVFSLATLKAYDRKYDALVEAVEQSLDETSIKRLLKRVTLTEAQKKDLLEVAEGAVEESEQSVAHLKNPWDLAKVFVGTGLSGLGLCGVFLWGTNRKAGLANMASAFGGVGAVAIALGGYSVVKGFSCSTARNRYKHAEDIEELVNEACAAAQDKAS